MFLFIRIRLKQEIGFQEQEREKSRLRLAVSMRREPRRVRSPMGGLGKELGPAQGDGKFPSPALGCRNDALAMGKVTSGARKE